MSLQPLRPSPFHPDAVIHASGGMPNQAPVPTGVGNTASTLGAQGSSDGCCSLIGKRFLTIKEKLVDLCLRIKDWIKSWFVSSPPESNPTPGNTSQPNPPLVNNPPEPNPPQPNPPLVNNPPEPNPPQPNPPLVNNPPEPNPPLVNNPPEPNPPQPNPPLVNNPPEPNPPQLNPPLVNNPPEPNPPQLNPPLVNNPPANPVNNLQPTPELILQTFGFELEYALISLQNSFESLADPNDGLAPPLAEIQARLLGIYDSFPIIIRRYIENKMEELKREANPEVELVPNWAYRIIRNELQYDNEAVPIGDIGESNILDPNHFFKRAIDQFIQEIGDVPRFNIQPTLTVLRIFINTSIFDLFIARPHNRGNLLVYRIRPAFRAYWNQFSPEIRDQIKRKMVEFAEVENPEVRGIPDWAERVMRVNIQDFNADHPLLYDDHPVFLIERYMNVFVPDSIFLRAVVELINEAPAPQLAQA